MADDPIDVGLAAMAGGAFEDALAAFDAALQKKPNDLDALYNRGAALQALGRNEEALGVYDAALARAPEAIAILQNRAGALVALGRLRDAADDLERVLRVRGNDEEVLLQAYQVHMTLNEFERAAALGERLVNVTGGRIDALERRGMALLSLGRYDVALADFDGVSKSKSDALSHVNRGGALMGLARYEEAASEFRHALQQMPDAGSAHYGLGLALFHMGQRDEGLARLERYAEAAPTSADPDFAKGLRLLSLGRYHEAWPLYERRWEAPLARMGPRRDNGEPAWDGARVDGVLRLWAEQGPGDQVLFARFIADALARTPRVAYACAPRFEALIKRSFPALERVAAEEEFAPGAAAAQAPMASLAALLNVAPENLNGRPYLIPGAARVAELKAKYRALAGGKPLIGIAWSSGNAISGALKTAPLSSWGALLRAPYAFVNLQYGAAADEARAAEIAFSCAILDDPDIDQMRDFDGFAAQIAALDAIVSVSNTTVHFAGALGVPCFVIPPPAGGLHWYWGVEGERTPWYDSVRLVRRARDEPWDAQITRAAALVAQYFSDAQTGR